MGVVTNEDFSFEDEDEEDEGEEEAAFVPQTALGVPAKLFELAKKREAVLELLKQVDLELEEVLEHLGVDSMYQDPTDLVVYKVVEPTGRYVTYKTIDYVRTRRNPDEKADLAMGEATARGFNLGANGPKKK